jgi:hypothetical protein
MRGKPNGGKHRENPCQIALQGRSSTTTVDGVIYYSLGGRRRIGGNIGKQSKNDGNMGHVPCTMKMTAGNGWMAWYGKPRRQASGMAECTRSMRKTGNPHAFARVTLWLGLGGHLGGQGRFGFLRRFCRCGDNEFCAIAIYGCSWRWCFVWLYLFDFNAWCMCLRWS